MRKCCDTLAAPSPSRPSHQSRKLNHPVHSILSLDIVHHSHGPVHARGYHRLPYLPVVCATPPSSLHL